MKIRPFAAEDAAACVALVAGHVPRFVQAAEVAEYADWLGRACGPGAAEPCAYFVGEVPGDGIVAVGGLAIAETAPVATLCWGLVRADRRGRGYGREMLRFRLELAAARPGLSDVLLDTTTASRGFFLRVGFAETGCTPNGYGPGWDRHDLRLDLGGWRARAGGAAAG